MGFASDQRKRLERLCVSQHKLIIIIIIITTRVARSA